MNKFIKKKEKPKHASSNIKSFPLTSSFILEQPKDQKDLQEEKREGWLKEVL